MTATPCLAHYGTTLAEPTITNDELATAPLTGQVADAHRLMDALGFRLLMRNLYPGLGRQWIFARGERGEAGYVEKDQFSSFTARPRPTGGDQRHVGDAIFRLPERDPSATRTMLLAEGLATAMPGDPGWVRAVDGQVYELAPLTGNQMDDRVVSVWTDPDDIDAIATDLVQWFGFAPPTRASVSDVATAAVLRRGGGGAATIRLLTPADGSSPMPRWRPNPPEVPAGQDIFGEQGYSHLRLGAPDRAAVKARFPEVFPDTGDVSYVLVHHLYLELVELPSA
jgi:hypothetical protein